MAKNQKVLYMSSPSKLFVSVVDNTLPVMGEIGLLPAQNEASTLL